MQIRQYDAWSWHVYVMLFVLMQTTTSSMELIWIKDSNATPNLSILNALYVFSSIQQVKVGLSCMKLVQMDRLNFSDNFSYINYFIWSYRLISMNFWSFKHFLEFSDLLLNKKIPANVFMTSAVCHSDVSSQPRSNLTVGPACHWDSVKLRFNPALTQLWPVVGPGVSDLRGQLDCH